MTIVDVRYQLNKILSYDKLRPDTCQKYEKLLKTLENAGDSRYLFYKARFLQKTEKLEEAKECYLEMLNNDVDIFAAYYGLYCLAVKDNNYEDAYKYILKCQELDNNSSADLGLHIALAKACYDLSTNPEEFYENDYTVTVDESKRNSNYNIARLYEEAVECFNKHDFVTATFIIKRICSIDNSASASFDSEILLNSINNLLVWEREKYLKIVDKNGVSAKFKNGNVNAKQLLNYMQMSIVTDLHLTERIFYENLDWLSQSTSDIAFEYIKLRIVERRKYENLNAEEMANYRDCMIQVRRSLKAGNFQEALDAAILGKELTGMPIFDYYTGQAYCRMGNNLEAIDKFREYLSTGGINALKARNYLSLVYTNIGDYENASLMREEISQLEKFYVRISKRKLDRARIFEITGNTSQSEEKMPAAGIALEVDKSMDEELSIGEFYSYSFAQKMALIRKLYSTNMVKVADKLMKETERESSNSVEKRFISKERQNKKLYIAKGKFGQH